MRKSVVICDICGKDMSNDRCTIVLIDIRNLEPAPSVKVDTHLSDSEDDVCNDCSIALAVLISDFKRGAKNLTMEERNANA